MIWVFLALLAIAAIVCAVAVWYHIKKRAARQAALSAVAASSGMRFLPEGFSSRHLWTSEPFDSVRTSNNRFTTQLDEFDPFQFRGGLTLENLLLLEDGPASIYAFDYRATRMIEDPGGGSSQQLEYGVVAMRVPLLMSKMRLTPNGFLARKAVPFGVKDISFESEDFNSRYFVSATDVKFAYDILHPQAIEYLLSIPARDWQFGNMWIVITQTGFFDAEEIGDICAELRTFVGMIPDYVWEDRGFEPKWRSGVDI
ncbi:MAG: hypothetical protein ACR2HJ_09195 [Fimbriimonadales bacterium]